MEFSFSSGVVVGIVIGVIGMNIFCPHTDTSSVPDRPTKVYGYQSSGYNYDNSYDDYESMGLHERGIH